MYKVFVTSFCVLFVVILLYRFHVGQSRRYNYEFNGGIENISFDVKMIPTLVVNGKSYYLCPLRHFKENVEVGDIAIKKSGERTLKVIKKSNGRILNYKL